TSKPGPNDPEGQDLLLLQPSLLESTVEVSYVEDGRAQRDSIQVRRAAESIEERISLLNLAAFDSNDAASLRYQVVKEPKQSHARRLEGLRLKTEAVGCHVEHFLPSSLSVRFDEVSAEVNSYLATILEPNSFGAFTHRVSQGKGPH